MDHKAVIKKILQNSKYLTRKELKEVKGFDQKEKLSNPEQFYLSDLERRVSKKEFSADEVQSDIDFKEKLSDPQPEKKNDLPAKNAPKEKDKGSAKKDSKSGDKQIPSEPKNKDVEDAGSEEK
jgi:hypothetical protein